MSRVFANGPGDQGSIPGRVITKTWIKWYFIPPCLTLSIIRYVSRIKWSNPGKRGVPSPTPWCSSYWKGSLHVTLDYSRQHTVLYLLGISWHHFQLMKCCWWGMWIGQLNLEVCFLDFVWFGFKAYKSIIVGNLMPNPVYTYIKYIWLVNIFCR